MLPKIVPLSKVVHLPISERDVRVYAFKIAEEKLLMLYKDSSDEEIEDVLIQLVESKVEKGFNVRELTVVDIIILLLNIVDISRGLQKEFVYKCNNIIDEKGTKCGNTIQKVVDISNYKLSTPVENHRLVSVTDGITCELVYPSYEVIKSIERYKNHPTEYLMRLYSKLIYAVYDGDDVTTDYSDDEIYEWTKDLPTKALKEFENFISALPEVTLEYEVVCAKCGNRDKYTIKSLIDFFT